MYLVRKDSKRMVLKTVGRAVFDVEMRGMFWKIEGYVMKNAVVALYRLLLWITTDTHTLYAYCVCGIVEVW
ncbi:hypothetical protein P3T76_015523 [Phytophthora citrophthora]|uniref:Uncharacterized protein n=1 Tax=Phytophthora citrophthora TaxID=4793 RepID=A0AAD9LBB9_9STRA|nr:hypothetical protein P3T76_015523 [Phytophthora citrophthora]